MCRTGACFNAPASQPSCEKSRATSGRLAGCGQASSWSGAFEARDCLCGIDDELALLGIGGGAENACELHAFWRLQRAGYQIGTMRFGKSRNVCIALQLIKEILHRNAQHLGNVVEPARADAVRAFLIFLHLLK